MKVIVVVLALVLPGLASAAVKNISEYQSYDCQVTGRTHGVRVQGDFMTVSIDEHFARFFQARFSLEGTDLQLQILIEETAETAVNGSVIVLQNLKVGEHETSVEATVQTVERTVTENGNVQASCEIQRKAP